MSAEPRKASLAAIFLVVAIDLLGFGLVIPQLGVFGVELSASPFAVGMLLSVYSLMQLFFAPVLGRLSDRFGRRPVLLYSVAGSLAGYLLFAFAQTLPLLFLARVVDGISGGNISTAHAYVADVTTPANRAKGMGLIGAAFGLGFILGPALGGFLGAAGGHRAIGLFAAALCAVNLALVFFYLPESRKPGSATFVSPAWRGPNSALRLPQVGFLLLLFLLVTTAFSQMEGTFSVFLLVRHLSPGGLEGARALVQAVDGVHVPLTREASLKVGYLFATVGVVSALVQGGAIGFLHRRLGEGRLVLLGSGLMALGLFAMPLAPSYGWLFAVVPLLAGGSAMCTPSLSALVSRASPPDRQGEVLGMYQSMGSLGRMVGPALGGYLFGGFGPAAPYVVAGGMMFGAAALALRLWGVRRELSAKPA